MPAEGWKIITVPEEVHRILQERARTNERSIAKELVVILRQCGIMKKKEVIKT